MGLRGVENRLMANVASQEKKKAFYSSCAHPPVLKARKMLMVCVHWW